MLYFMWNTKYDLLIDWWMNVSGVNVSRVFVALDTTDFHFMNKISWNILQTIPWRNREVRFRCGKNMYICKGMEEFWLLGNTKWEWGVGRVLRQGRRSQTCLWITYAWDSHVSKQNLNFLLENSVFQWRMDWLVVFSFLRRRGGMNSNEDYEQWMLFARKERNTAWKHLEPVNV